MYLPHLSTCKNYSHDLKGGGWQMLPPYFSSLTKTTTMNYIKSNNPEEVTVIMDKYYDSLGIPNVLESRNRKHLVPRVALINGISDFFTLKAMADSLGKHHATILHYLKLDETYSMHYKSYGYFKRGARSIYDISFGESQVVKRMLSKIEEYKQELEENEAVES